MWAYEKVGLKSWPGLLSAYLCWHVTTRVPWSSGKITQTSFPVAVYNYRINTSGLRDLTPWSRVLGKVIVSRLINKFPTTCDEELLYPSFLIYLICLPLHGSDQLLVAGAWFKASSSDRAGTAHAPPRVFTFQNVQWQKLWNPVQMFSKDV